MFPLGTVLFPGLVLPLHVFEERYRALVRHLIGLPDGTPREFGVVAIRQGYHPFVTAYGYDAYYLNVLAGERRSMAASDDPEHARFRRHWPPPDPRLPMVPRGRSPSE